MIGAACWLVLAIAVAGLLARRGEEDRRATCRRVGHAWVESRTGAPVTEFEVCRRCGKIGERL